MNNQGPPGPYIPRHMPEALKGLVGLALDLRWSWHHGSDQLWSTLDREMWEATANAWLVLNSVSGQRLQELADDADFLALLAAQLAEQDAYNQRDTWCDSRHGEQAFDPVAFFAWNLALPNPCRCIPAGWACWPATTSRRLMTWVSPSLP